MKLIAKNLKKTFDSLEVISDISLELSSNEFISILGVSGSGKSTLFNILSGLLKADQGEVLKDGKDITGKTGQMGYMQQKDLLLPWFKVLDNICLPLTIKGVPKNTAYEEAKKHLDRFGLDGYENYYPDQLSGGLRQRAALLRTFLFSSDVILLDEPFAKLDAITKDLIHDWFKQIQQDSGFSCILITHDVEEAIKLSDRIYLISEKPSVIKKEFVVERTANKASNLDLKEQILRELYATVLNRKEAKH